MYRILGGFNGLINAFKHNLYAINRVYVNKREKFVMLMFISNA